MKETRVQPTKLTFHVWTYGDYCIEDIEGVFYLYNDEEQRLIADFDSFGEACEFLYEMENSDGQV